MVKAAALGVTFTPDLGCFGAEGVWPAVWSFSPTEMSSEESVWSESPSSSATSAQEVLGDDSLDSCVGKVVMLSKAAWKGELKGESSGVEIF
jgi:hypothetical protein